jgi:threonine synthase
LVFEYLDRDGAATAELMEEFRKTGRMTMPQGAYGAMCELFEGHRYDDQETLAVMRVMKKTTGEILDPHSAIGVAAGIKGHDYKRSTMVALATAHPAKFPDAVEKATGKRPPLPDHLADLFSRRERFDVLPNDLGAVRDYVAAFNGRNQA